MKLLLCLAAVLLALAACGPHASVSGLVNGKALSAKSSGARIDSTNPAFKQVFLLIGDSEQTCNPAGGPPLWNSGGRGVEIDFRIPADGGATVTSGTFPGALTVFAVSNCSSGRTFAPSPAGSGDATVTLYSVSPTLNGTFTSTLASGGTLEGSFTSPLCEGIGAGSATCK